MRVRGRAVAIYLAQCAVTVALVLAMGLVLRFCARTYPGIYVPQSSFLNAIFNGDLVGNGYVAALGAGLLQLLVLTLDLLAIGQPGWLRLLRSGLVAVCFALGAFGLFVAAALHRLGHSW